jgi:hypothetical protein
VNGSIPGLFKIFQFKEVPLTDKIEDILILEFYT